MTFLKLHLQQIADHFTRRNAGGSPQSWEIQGAGEGIRVAEEKHRGDPATSVLKGKAGRFHLVLLNLTTTQVVDGASRVDLGLVLAGDVGQLSASEDVEVIISGVTAGVALGSDGSAEDDQVFGDTGMDDVHSAHGTACIVEHPFFILVQVGGSDLLLELGNNVVNNGTGVIAVRLDSALGELVQMLVIEDVELVQARIEEAVDGGEQSEEDSDDAQSAEGEAAAATG